MTILSKTFQTLSKNKLANKMAKKYGLKFGAQRFVAGKDIHDAIVTANNLKKEGLSVIYNYLGEFSDNKESCSQTTKELIECIKAMSDKSNDCYLSVKLSSIGLEISEEYCIENLTKILFEAEKGNVFVRLEMENYSLCDKTLNVYKEIRKNFDNVGTVIQAYLYRTDEDMEKLYEYAPNLRLVKGAYNEPSNVAYSNKNEVDQKYKELITTHLLNGHFASIATHDDDAVNHALKIIKDNNISKDKFEFQMLHGIRADLQKKLSDSGYKVRVYLPYGSDWFGYFMRRLGERPENVSFVLKNTFQKGVA